jgi:hypothetical protein
MDDGEWSLEKQKYEKESIATRELLVLAKLPKYSTKFIRAVSIHKQKVVSLKYIA